CHDQRPARCHRGRARRAGANGGARDRGRCDPGYLRRAQSGQAAPPGEGATMTRVHEDITEDRRNFLKGVGLAVLTVQFLPLIAHASGDSASDGNDDANNLSIHFTPGLFSHVHDLLIPYAVLKTPPAQGVELLTTQAMFHRHSVKLTHEQLLTVSRGGSVTGKASSHRFVIALANRGQS